MGEQNYGVISWFDVSKGFGVAQTINGKSIFILSRNIDKYPKEGDLISIDEIEEDKARKKLNGKGVVVWADSDQLSKYIFDKWRKNKALRYCIEIEMLLKICDEQLLAKIIKLNKAFWLDNADFTSNLAIACNRREIDFRLNQNLYKRVTEGYLKVVADFYFQVWKKHRKYKGYLSWLFTIYGTRKEWSYDQKQKINSELLTKVLAIDYNWIFETAFANDFTARSSNQLFIEKRIIYDLIINLIKSKDRKEFSQEFIWLINNGNDSIIDFILEDTNHFSNAAFVEQFKAKWQLYSKRSYSKFLTTYILSQHDLTISADLKWLLEHGETEHLHQIINTHQIYWQNNSAFVEQILSFKSVTNRKRVYHKRLDIDDPLVVDYQIEAFQEFIYEIWKSKGKIIFDTHLDWLFTNGNDSFLHDVFEIEKKIWINEKGIIDFMFDEKIKFWPDRMFLEAFFIELCLNPKHTHHKKAMTRLFTEGSLEAIKVLITKKLNYSTEILEKIYSAFYPSNDLAYYSKKAINSEWSPDFKEQYIRERVSLINMQFKRLFKEEMEAEASQLVKKTWSKKSTHSATDLANFAFCPASYFLNQKYELNIEEQENVFIGNTEHNKQRLLRLADRTGAKEQKTNAKFKNFYLDFSRILHAKAIAQGHGTTKPVIHYSKKGKLSGIPDYIFKDEHSHFAVEEKFTFKKFEELTELYYSHKIQALTYLYGLDQFSFSEVLVIYWFVKKDQNGNHSVYNYRIFRVARSAANKAIIVDTFNAVDTLDTSGNYHLPQNFINYKKCVRCNYFKICGYKK